MRTCILLLALLLTGCGSSPQPSNAEPQKTTQQIEKEARTKVEAELATKDETKDGIYVKTFKGGPSDSEGVDARVNEFLRGEGRRHLTTQANLSHSGWYLVTITYEYKAPKKP